MVDKNTSNCTCENPEEGFYYMHRGKENGCSCKINTPHKHCTKCGGLLQVS